MPKGAQNWNSAAHEDGCNFFEVLGHHFLKKLCSVHPEQPVVKENSTLFAKKGGCRKAAAFLCEIRP